MEQFNSFWYLRRSTSSGQHVYVQGLCVALRCQQIKREVCVLWSGWLLPPPSDGECPVGARLEPAAMPALVAAREEAEGG